MATKVEVVRALINIIERKATWGSIYDEFVTNTRTVLSSLDGPLPLADGSSVEELIRKVVADVNQLWDGFPISAGQFHNHTEQQNNIRWALEEAFQIGLLVLGPEKTKQVMDDVNGLGYDFAKECLTKEFDYIGTAMDDEIASDLADGWALTFDQLIWQERQTLLGYAN